MSGLRRAVNIVKGHYKITQTTGLLILLQQISHRIHAVQGFLKNRFIECESPMPLKLPRHIRFLIAVELLFEPVSLSLFLLQIRFILLHPFELFPIGSKVLTQIDKSWIIPFGSRKTLN